MATMGSLMLVLALHGAGPQTANEEAARPNIVILLADDLGYADVGFNGGKIRTPNLDRLCKEGVRLARFYSCPMCSPTRAGLMTGRWPIRYGLMRAVIPPWSKYGLPTDEQTLPQVLASARYRHRACVGKWHLGHSRRKFLPPARGFTLFHGHYNGAIDYFTHQREGELDWHRDGETLREQGYSTDLIGRAAARFVTKVPRGEPYLLYVPFNAPHSPFQAKEDDVARYGAFSGRRRTYAAMVDSMDQAVGNILKAIDERGDADNTFILFFSDNGGVRNVADNSPLRGAKLTVYEGGIRVAAAVRWPAGGLKGGITSTARMGYIDVLPTLRRVTGVTARPTQPLDGIDVLDAMKNKGELPDRPWFSYQGQSPGTELFSVNTDEWKLVATGPPINGDKFTDAGQLSLFHIKEDPHEKTDVAADHPEVLKRLLKQARDFRDLKIDGVSPYAQGRQGFVAPKDWKIEQ